MSLTEHERAYLEDQPLARLATVGPDGDPQNNPVGVFYNEETGSIDIRGYSMGKTRKYRNVKGNPRVALVIDDLVSRQPWTVRGLEIRGEAEALSVETPPGSPFSPEIIRIHPRLIFSWGVEPGTEGVLRRTLP
ncbi:PPOX class F420-dependent oxidoreductase [Spirillospora sp. CA-294931]|uniref:PPOX class F420-dependent oxidoreductase n=1 Tax=Spirillospora sp. CA-294931 TaxID=3240042 RepID=UPI003D8A8685